MVEKAHDAVANAAVHDDGRSVGLLALHDVPGLQQKTQFNLWGLHRLIVYSVFKFLQQKLRKEEKIEVIKVHNEGERKHMLESLAPSLVFLLLFSVFRNLQC